MNWNRPLALDVLASARTSKLLSRAAVWSKKLKSVPVSRAAWRRVRVMKSWFWTSTGLTTSFSGKRFLANRLPDSPGLANPALTLRRRGRS